MTVHETVAQVRTSGDILRKIHNIWSDERRTCTFLKGLKQSITANLSAPMKSKEEKCMSASFCLGGKGGSWPHVGRCLGYQALRACHGLNVPRTSQSPEAQRWWHSNFCSWEEVHFGWSHLPSKWWSTLLGIENVLGAVRAPRTGLTAFGIGSSHGIGDPDSAQDDALRPVLGHATQAKNPTFVDSDITVKQQALALKSSSDGRTECAPYAVKCVLLLVWPRLCSCSWT